MTIAVAIVGTVMGVLVDRHNRFRRLASYHAARGSHGPWYTSLSSDTLLWRIDMEEWHASLADKYDRAAWHPWEPIAADPDQPMIEKARLERMYLHDDTKYFPMPAVQPSTPEPE
jgi:hypothetical protein